MKLLLGDCLDKLKELEANSVDSIVTDPPYGLAFMGKKWDYDVPSQAIWEECMRVLKPGGHILSFAGSRTYHRMAVRIEDAGFEIRDQIMWIYGSGFPKSHNVGNAIDKKNGAGNRGHAISSGNQLHPTTGLARPNGEKLDKYEARTEEGKGWEGWGTALKPAHEPIVMARKPIVGTVADNVLEWGVGGINIDGCRVSAGNDYSNRNSYTDRETNSSTFQSGGQMKSDPNDGGRFPANIILDEEAGKILDEQSGNIKGGKNMQPFASPINNPVRMNSSKQINRKGYEDNGGASRFFYCPKASKKDRDEGMPESVPQFTGRPRREDGSVIYKETHAEEWAEAMAKKERKDKTSLAGAEEKLQQLNGAKVIKGRDAGQDSRSVAHKARPTARMNIHPTVKPTELMKYLIRLVTPKGGVVLDPFMGSGSTGKAAVIEGMEFIGIEREEEYYEIAKQRIENETNKRKFF
jgi:site-specific DNA-methyltransferase (adenine-specific)